MLPILHSMCLTTSTTSHMAEVMKPTVLIIAASDEQLMTESAGL